MDLNEHGSAEIEYGEELREKVVEFIMDFDPWDDRDPYYVAEIIFGVPESISKKWMDVAYSKKKVITLEPRPKGLRSDIQRIVHSLESIRKSALKLDEYNKQLIAELKKKIGGEKEQ